MLGLPLLPPLNRPIADWRGHRVWIIGASSGIGAALALDLLDRGAHVALSARNAPALHALAQAHPHSALALAFDASSPAEWTRAHAELRRSWEAVDLVVFCAAIYQPERAWEIQAARVEHTLAVNLGSVYYGLETLLPGLMQAGHGGVAIVASVAGYTGLPTAAVYGPSKAALINLAELLYTELRPHGLDVYLINPGFVRTRLTARNRFAMPALQTPQQAAHAIVRGLERGKFEIHFPRRFTMLVRMLRLLPYRLRFALLRRTAAA